MLNPALKSSGLWTPRRLGPALALWIDPSDPTTMFQSNAGTTAVTDTSVCGYAGDKSGNVFHLTSAADDTTRPTWNFNGGRPYLNFDGTNDVLLRAADLGLYAAGAASIFFAINANPSAGGNVYLFSGGSSSDAAPIYASFNHAGTPTSADFFIRNDATSNVLAATIQALAYDNTDRVFGIVDDGANITAYLDGVAGTPAAYTRSGALTLNRFAIGALVRTTTAAWFATRLQGVVAAKRVIAPAERAKLVTYLGSKQGRTL